VWDRVRHGVGWRVRRTKRALSSRRSQPAPPPAQRILHFAPKYKGNPYQQMLYARLADVDAVAVPVKKITKHLAAQAESDSPGLFHLHWTNPILQPAETASEARTRLDDFTRALASFTAAGGTLVWTIHNVLPHDARFTDLEVELARTILRHAARVHLLSEQTLKQATGHYFIDPAKVVTIELSSYAGVYPNTISRREARARLGIEPDDKTLLVAGYIRPYKGIDRMLDVFDELVSIDPSLRLLIAGKPLDADGMADLEARCAAHPRVVSRFERIPDDELQVWYGAADVAVLPYTNILNSAAFRLATSLGVPAVGPRMGALTAYDGKSYVLLFDPDSTDDLREVVRAAVTRFAGSYHFRKAALQDAEAHSPDVMAAEFARFIEPLLPPPSPIANTGTLVPQEEFDQK
jgi:glycosyltransferase involved in cell wall biosynthesis